MVTYKYCPECLKVFQVKRKITGFIICPFCLSTNSYTINRKQYERERELKNFIG